MWLLTYKNYGVLCWGRIHMWTKFGDDWSKIATCIMENVTISFKHEYRRETLTSRCDVIGDIIIMKIILVYDLHTILLYLLSNLGYIENCEIFKNFQNWRKFEVGANFFIISVTGNELCYLDSQSNFLRFELLIDVVAQKLMELWHFQNLTYFLTSWPSYLTYILVQRTCRNHGLVLACNEVWWWLTEPFLRFCEISVQTNKHTNEKAIGDCVLAKICWYNAHCNGKSDSWDIGDNIDVWQLW